MSNRDKANKTTFPKSPVNPVSGGVSRLIMTYAYDADLPFTEWGPNPESLKDRLKGFVDAGGRVTLLTGKVFKGVQTKPNEVGYKTYEEQINAECPKESLRIQRQVSLFGLEPHIHFTSVRLVVGPTVPDVDAIKQRIIHDTHNKEILL